MFEDYFTLQLRFAGRYSSVAHTSFAAAISSCTNLRRRLNLMGVEGEKAWNNLLNFADTNSSSLVAIVDKCVHLHEFYGSNSKNSAFGCFSYEPPNVEGVVRIHFLPAVNQESSPLSPERIAERRCELKAMFAEIRLLQPRAKVVRGVSWLYNLNAYKRLFPAAFVAAIEEPRFPVHLNGTSTWGQVLDWRQRVKPDIEGRIASEFPNMREQAPWEIFPLKALTTHCEIEKFYEHLL
ncbi:hypothetical protein [Comamonas sp. B-9]|uniref:hypothetical protein n=1 Tax=Comamonas sp. B-9 TaxID=1055192 RepID=UPI0005BE0931|nr:hypothetical protein [Comamonas sp. B-9]